MRPSTSLVRPACALILACIAVMVARPAASAKDGVASNSQERTIHLPSEPESLTLSFSSDFQGFDARPFNPGKWQTNFGYGDANARASRTLPSNGEQQVYVDPNFTGGGTTPLGISPFSVHGGQLDITADRTPEQAKPSVWGLPYTSGLITTRQSFHQLYGYFEMKAKLPAGRGLWPAFWLLPSGGGWPPELDVMEMLGNDPGTIYATPHYRENGVPKFHSFPVKVQGAASGFHLYGVAWNHQTIRWYVDRQPVAEFPTPSDMNVPMYMLANLAVGGYWPKNPDATTPFPSVMTIAYIRAYRYSDQASGR
ncbi:glycoside hydrolase family 16 protein [Caulobacter sp. S45]|jgi:serralysin|uniref:glycoside hydrolase family 16 protein n=1 Tax=Caulobacter sp. S45 TaxID=1641861 RepID=UPI00131E734F|nr:glycoside hydrolase family 16 protein [Caulobacter sp. S45]